MTTPRDVRGFEGFPLGMDNRRRETDSFNTDPRRPELEGVLRDAVNVDISVSGNVKRRKGYTRLHAGNVHSLWSDPRWPWMYAVVDGVLTAYDCKLSPTQLCEVAPHLPVSYALLNNEVYLSNGEDSLCIDEETGNVHPWGLPPLGAPIAVAVPEGGMRAGTYLVAQTQVGGTGLWHEGGSAGYAVVTLKDNEGLQVTAATVTQGKVNIYVSPPNGDVLYRAATVSSGVTIQISPGDIGEGKQLRTYNARHPFPGTIVRAFNGRIYVASGSVLWATDPLNPYLVRPAESVLMFASSITMVQPVLDGIYVSTEREGTVFLSGSDIMEFSKVRICASHAVRGTGTAIDAKHLFPGARGPAAVWWSSDGVLCAGGPGGQVEFKTEQRLDTPEYSAGMVGLYEHDGFSQILGVLRDEGQSNNLSAGDSVIAEVRRNGVKA